MHTKMSRSVSNITEFFYTNVPFLHGKSVSRVKSVSIQGPQVVQMDHEWENISLRGELISRGRETFYKLRMELCSILT